MPNRMLRESICVSPSIEQLDWFEEVFFYRLIVNCDDFGRIDARPLVLKAKLFPLREVDTAQIQATVEKLCQIGCLYAYEVGGQPYLCATNWMKYQQLRSKRVKYPEPESGADNLPARADNSPPQYESQSESQKENESEKESECEPACATSRDEASAPAGTQQQQQTIVFLNPSKRGREASDSRSKQTLVCESGYVQAYAPGIKLPMANGAHYFLSVAEADKLRKAYPNADLDTELRRVSGRLMTLPDGQRDERQTRALIRTYMEKAHNHGPPPGAPPQNPVSSGRGYEQRGYTAADFDEMFPPLCAD